MIPLIILALVIAIVASVARDLYTHKARSHQAYLKYKHERRLHSDDT